MTEQNKQAIVLIPEIALVYQTLKRFYNVFGERVTVINSKMSAGEKYDQFERAKNGEIDVIIGPRSAFIYPLFQTRTLLLLTKSRREAIKVIIFPNSSRETAIARAGYVVRLWFGIGTP